jgi:hypothetical protein
MKGVDAERPLRRGKLPIPRQMGKTISAAVKVAAQK